MEVGNALFGNARGKFPVNREWQDRFCEHLNEMGFDGYGFIQTGHEHLENFITLIASEEDAPVRVFENETFSLMPYYWGDDENISVLPNFVYKPTGFQLSWYKYALRDSYMNQEITFDVLDDLLKHCKNSLEGVN